MRACAFLLAAFAISGCGAAPASKPEPVTHREHGLAVELPVGWQTAEESLTPELGDPRERLSAGTFPLRYRGLGCAHMPSSALADIGPRDAFLTLQERGVDPGSDWEGFPPRPQHFGPLPHDASEASNCVRDPRFTDHWIWFTDGGRHFHLLVAFGTQASAATRQQTWSILDSLVVDPEVRPDWSSTP
jgi:hypothetical protein